MFSPTANDDDDFEQDTYEVVDHDILDAPGDDVSVFALGSSARC